MSQRSLLFSKSVKQLVDKEKTWVLLENDFHDVLDSKGNIIEAVTNKK